MQIWHFLYIFGVFVTKRENNGSNSQFYKQTTNSQTSKQEFSKDSKNWLSHWNSFACILEGNLDIFRLKENIAWNKNNQFDVKRSSMTPNLKMCVAVWQIAMFFFGCFWHQVRKSTFYSSHSSQYTRDFDLNWKRDVGKFFSIKHLFYWFNIPILFAPTLKRWFCNAVKYRVLCIMLVFLNFRVSVIFNLKFIILVTLYLEIFCARKVLPQAKNIAL